MKINIEVEIEPFTVPNFVRRKRIVGEKVGLDDDTTGIPLKEIDSLTLDKLCNEYRQSVFTKAGKQQPPRPA